MADDPEAPSPGGLPLSYLGHRRLRIVVLATAVLVVLPLIGWAGYHGALAAARAVRPPARVRYRQVWVGGGSRVEFEAEIDDVLMLYRCTGDGGGGSGSGGCDDVGTFLHAGTYSGGSFGRLKEEIVPAGRWLPLQRGEGVTLAVVELAHGKGHGLLEVWCAPGKMSDWDAQVVESTPRGSRTWNVGRFAARVWANFKPPSNRPPQWQPAPRPSGRPPTGWNQAPRFGGKAKHYGDQRRPQI